VHEYSIVQALLARAEEEVRARKALAVRQLTVRLGDLSGVEADLFASAYELFRERTPCEGAELVVERVPAVWMCAACGVKIARDAALTCPICGSPAALAQGDEIVLARIEMEVP
jgi:hydrogenase nickel incorporation protein HypA/HybF